MQLHSIQKKSNMKSLVVESCENNEYAKFQLHTAVLLHFIANRKEITMKGDWTLDIKIGINIFEVDHYKLQTDGLQSNLEYVMGLDFGDVCIKSQHLIPNLANCWRGKFPGELEKILRIGKNVGCDKIWPIMFQTGAARKEFKKLFIESQKSVNVYFCHFPLVMIHCIGHHRQHKKTMDGSMKAMKKIDLSLYS